ncbi:zinc ABC transporter substrate-binding protein [Cypionkella sp.]|uniref:zinc ABC transporter substrate-binding protein n=1 Tax=Cypionkella sp. TaxID=2811411 RepID=UPI002AB80119|nr:zinc ABC transporter substrate-binding protein [Cypionkella sp.]MDZ4394977.1 zinc ABC transporter substrate-binding protein [Cypionkella sp.]
MRYIISLALASLPTAALAEVPNVVTDIPPVHALVAQVMGDLGTPVLLLEKGADEHDFQLRPSQMQSIADADTVIWIGPELTPWLDRAMTDSKAVSLALLDAKGTQTQAYPAGQAEEEEHHDHDEADHAEHVDHAGHADEAEHAHSHDGTDPHAWMNPANAATWVDLIAADLSTLDPENAATYAANAANAKTRIATMDAEITAQLAAIKDKPFVTFHAAYGYFAAHYGLGHHGSLALGDATTPGAAKLTQLQAELKSGAYTCAFPEVQHDPAMLTQLMQGTATKLGQPLDPVGSSLDFGPNAYDNLMRSIANSLSACLNG